MIDSVLKGTGNSRFLKSAVPAGTSWADALAMLQAGTFPIDFNGINTEGFQQVGTPLNKANLLKDATAAQIGLPPSTTPDGMFQALGNTGELHVWRKTVKTSSDTPAGYTLGNTLTHGDSFIVRQTNGTGYVDAVIQEASSISVNDNGVISASWGGTITLRYGNSVTFTPGRFVKISSINTKALSSFAVDDVVWVPSDGGIQMNFSNDYGYYIEFTKCQKVNAHGIIPAVTTTTYPVSTNPNAYQEGDDAKAAGYVLGDVETGKFVLGTGMGSGKQNLFYISSSVTVDDSGNISQENQGSTYVNGENNNTMQGNANNVIGKFVVLNSKNSNSDFDVGTIWYIPPDATIGNSYLTDGGSYDQFNITNYVTKRQPVTGYAAIPAGTTIEYLGKLGDKARVQVVSYVGTGTYGANNPCSITADFKIKVARFVAAYKHGGSNGVSTTNAVMTGDSLTTSYQEHMGTGNSSGYYAKKSSDGKTFSWYQTGSSTNQLNYSGAKYWVLIIG